MSHESGRPGGLTVLAVVNLLVAAGALLRGGFLAAAAGWSAFGSGDSAAVEEAFAPLRGIPLPNLVLSATLELATLILAVLSALGYLRQRRTLGRHVGTVFGLVLLAARLLPLTEDTLASLWGVLYAATTLLLVNTVFRHDLVR